MRRNLVVFADTIDFLKQRSSNSRRMLHPAWIG
jgi:hypothetical protein